MQVEDPALRYLFVSLDGDSRSSYLDPGAALMEGLFGLAGWENGLADARSQAIALLKAQDGEQELAAALVERGVNLVDPPEGPTWRAWLQSVVDRLDRWMAQMPSPDEEDADQPSNSALPRVSTFPDEDTANNAVTQLVRANDPALRAWLDDQGGHTRWVGHHDTGTTIGRIMTAGIEGTTDTTALTAVMRIDPASGNPYVQTAYPEHPLDQTIRATYPDLCHIMGGYFGQDWDAEDVSIWGAQRSFQRHTTAPARARVRDQFDALIALPNNQFTHALTHLGCYVRPASDARLRGWVERMRWRMDAFDWTTTAT